MTSQHDPFNTADVRSATLQAWRSSPTRLAEDIAAETDLVTVGYRDRLLTELAANAADAAAASGEEGSLAIWVSGREVHVANTGAPLTAAGVQSLSALRVSAKSGGAVGRFGVGFTATATVADRVEVRSTSGSVVFDREATATAIRDIGVAAAALTAPEKVPLLRLPWTTEVRPASGFDTELVLYLRADIGDLIAAMAAQAPDLLLELPALQRISVADTTISVSRVELPEQSTEDVQCSEIVVTTTVDEQSSDRRWLQVAQRTARWLVAADESSEALGYDVLRAPTPTDLELSLPCRLIADLPLTPDRRHLHPDADLATTAAGYVDLMRLVGRRRRLRLVPEQHRARNRDDARLIDAVRSDLRDCAWLPAAGGEDLVPTRAVVLAGLSDELAQVLGGVFGDLVHPDLSAAADVPVLRRLGVDELGLAQLADRLAGVERDPGWWQRLYTALSPLAATSRELEELAALPVPRSDGRMSTGARGLFVSERIGARVRWLPTVDPAARHPLLERLGAVELTVEQALADPALRQLIELDADYADKQADEEGLADEVLELLVADPDAYTPAWLVALPLPDVDGELRPADELLLPDSPLLSVLVDDHPFGIADTVLVERYGADVLRKVGVGWGFTTVSDELPTGPDHELPDEEQWWDALAEPPEMLSAVRDLDLVDDRRWDAALTLLATDSRIASLLADRDGYTAWWLRHYAIIDNQTLGNYRAPSDESLDGVFDPLEHEFADGLSGSLAQVNPADAADAADLLNRLADPDRDIAAGIAAVVYGGVVAACRRGTFEIDDVAVPEGGRTLAGTVGANVVVVDQRWWLAALDDADAVQEGVAVDAADARILADLLDIPTASEAYVATIGDPGQVMAWSSAPAARFAALYAVELSHGEIRIHDELWITLTRNGDSRDVQVRWWVDERGVTHIAGDLLRGD